MTETLAHFTLLVIGAYLGIGLAISVVSVLIFMRRIEPSGAPLPIKVRILLLPGMIALWPVIVMRILGRKPAEDRR
jgi:hypothetical protein